MLTKPGLWAAWRRQYLSGALVLLLPRIFQDAIDIEFHRRREGLLDPSHLLNDLICAFLIFNLRHAINLQVVLLAYKGLVVGQFAEKSVVLTLRERIPSVVCSRSEQTTLKLAHYR